MAAAQDPRRLAWWLFLRSHRAVLRVLEAELKAELGLSLTWYDVLAQLAAAPRGHLLMHELADAIVLSNSGLTRLVDRMEEAGLLRRQPMPGNRRAIELRLTPIGEARYRKAREIHERGIEEHFVRHLDRAEGEAMLAALERVLAAAGSVRTRGG
jgi:DNA-binding MarR family transcriptional regulator